MSLLLIRALTNRFPTQWSSTIPHRILVADEGTDACDIVTQALGYLGYSSTCVESVSAALDLLEKESFAGIFTELVLKGGTGFDVLAAARRSERNAGAPVIALSGFHEYRHRTTEEGFSAFVAKPVEVSRLRPILAQLIPLSH